MGCSRPGALAVVCVLLAGALSVLSLVLPYWSKLQINLPTQEHLELSFGLWSSCVDVQLPLETTDTSRSESFICGSYYHQELVQITCTSLQQFSMGQCTKNKYKTSASLCRHEQATSFLGNSVATTAMGDWLAFLDRACGSIGHASVSFAVTSAVGTGLCLILLLIGISCASIESCLGKIGGWCALVTALAQGVLCALWIVQAYVVKDKQMTLATSFYLNAISLGLHLAGFSAVRKHQRLVQEAEAEIDLPIEFLKKEMEKTLPDQPKTIRPIGLEPV